MENADSKGLALRVLTPARTVLEKQVDFVLLRTTEGDMGVLHGHEPCAALLDAGALRAYQNRRETDVLMLMGGFATVRENTVTVLTTFAEPPDRVEDALAKIEEERAQNRLRERSADLEIHRAEKALRQTLVKMDISSYSLIKGKEEQGEAADERE